MKTLCPHCEKEIVNNSYKQHIATCQLRPTKQELIDFRAVDNLGYEEVASVLSNGVASVSSTTVRKWYKEFEIDIPITLERKKELIVYPGTAVAYGRNGGCENCVYNSICRRNVKSGKQILCEAKSERR